MQFGQQKIVITGTSCGGLDYFCKFAAAKFNVDIGHHVVRKNGVATTISRLNGAAGGPATATFFLIKDPYIVVSKMMQKPLKYITNGENDAAAAATLSLIVANYLAQLTAAADLPKVRLEDLHILAEFFNIKKRIFAAKPKYAHLSPAEAVAMWADLDEPTMQKLDEICIMYNYQTISMRAQNAHQMAAQFNTLQAIAKKVEYKGPSRRKVVAMTGGNRLMPTTASAPKNARDTVVITPRLMPRRPPQF